MEKITKQGYSIMERMVAVSEKLAAKEEIEEIYERKESLLTCTEKSQN